MFLYSVWRGTSLSTRMQIARVFGIAKVGPTHVKDNYVESDGYKIEDVERALTAEAMQQYLGMGGTSDMQVLFDLVVAKVEGREEPTMSTETISISITPELPKEEVKPKRKYTKKK